MTKEFYDKTTVFGFNVLCLLGFASGVFSIVIGFFPSEHYFIIIGIAVGVFLFSLVFAAIVLVNRLGSKVTINSEEKTITRRGYFRGFFKCISFNEVKQVERYREYKLGIFLVFIDNTFGIKSGESSLSYIRIPYSIENVEYLSNLGFEIVDNQSIER